MSTLKLLQFNKIVNPDGTYYVEVEFIPDGIPEFIEGYDKLVQKFIFTLLTTIGSDQFNPEKGGNLLGVLDAGYNVTDGSINDIRNNLLLTFDKLIEDIKREQADVEVTNAEQLRERLRDAQLMDVKRGTQDDEIQIDFSIESEYNTGIDLVESSSNFRINLQG